MNLQDRTMQLQYHYYYTKIEGALIKGWRPAPQTLVNNKTQLGIERVQACKPYSLTFRVRVTTHPAVGTTSLRITSRTQQARRLYRRRGESSPACVVRAACGGPGELPLDSATHFQCCHSNATRAPIANPSNSAQLGGIPYHSPKLHPGPCNSVGMRQWTDTQTQIDRHTDACDHNTFLVVYDSCEM